MFPCTVSQIFSQLFLLLLFSIEPYRHINVLMLAPLLDLFTDCAFIECKHVHRHFYTLYFYAEDGAMYADALLAKTALESFKVQLFLLRLWCCSRRELLCLCAARCWEKADWRLNALCLISCNLWLECGKPSDKLLAIISRGPNRV